MGLLFQIVWGAKVVLLGCNTFKLCTDAEGSWIVCGMSGIYFGILVLATLVSHKRLPTPNQLDRLEKGYLTDLEEGLFNTKQA